MSKTSLDKSPWGSTELRAPGDVEKVPEGPKVPGDGQKVPEGPKVIGMVLKMTFTCFLIIHVVFLHFFYPSRFSESFARKSESVSGTSIFQEGTLTPSTLCLPWCSPATAQSSPSCWRTWAPSPHHKAKGRTEEGAKKSPLSCHSQVTKISAGQQGMPCVIYLHLQHHFQGLGIIKIFTIQLWILRKYVMKTLPFRFIKDRILFSNFQMLHKHRAEIMGCYNGQWS